MCAFSFSYGKNNAKKMINRPQSSPLRRQVKHHESATVGFQSRPTSATPSYETYPERTISPTTYTINNDIHNNNDNIYNSLSPKQVMKKQYSYKTNDFLNSIPPSMVKAIISKHDEKIGNLAKDIIIKLQTKKTMLEEKLNRSNNNNKIRRTVAKESKIFINSLSTALHELANGYENKKVASLLKLLDKYHMELHSDTLFLLMSEKQRLNNQIQHVSNLYFYTFNWCSRMGSFRLFDER